MNDLLLKTLCDGFPHGLKLWDKDSELGTEVIELTQICFLENRITVADEHGNFDIPIEDIKPILRPLSELTVEIVHNGERFVPCKKLGIPRTAIKMIDFEIAAFISADGADPLNEWHFNWRGLPEDQYVKVTERFNPYA